MSMTESEAILELQQNIDLPFGVNVSDEASELAIKALEKQIPNKPIKNKSGDSTCMCGLIIRNRNKINCLYYCHNCGQKLDWSN